MFTVFRRAITTGITGFWRNLWLSIAATIVMTLTLLLIGGVITLHGMARTALVNLENRLDISVYVRKEVSEEKILEIKSHIESFPEVRDITYVSREQALADFRDRHKNNPRILDALAELSENPLRATLNIKANTLDAYADLAHRIEEDPALKDSIARVNFEDNRRIIERMQQLSANIRRFGSGLVAIFVAIALLVVYNTVRLTIFSRKEEIEIMRLVGATNWYIRGPFLLEGVLYGLTGAAFTTTILTSILLAANERINAFLGAADWQVILPGGSIWYLILLEFFAGILVSITSGAIAIRRYLKI
jgi:cell division transport system permease protein